MSFVVDRFCLLVCVSFVVAQVCLRVRVSWLREFTCACEFRGCMILLVIVRFVVA